MGRTAVRVNTRIVAGDPPESRRLELATHLVVRDSTAPPAVGQAREPQTKPTPRYATTAVVG
jgi:LacI family transcriptional regulator